MPGGVRSFTIEQCEGPCVAVHAESSLVKTPIVVEHCSKSLNAVGVTAASDVPTRLLLLAKACMEMQPDMSWPSISRLTDREEYFVRWGAVREIASWDSRIALKILEKMSHSDANAEIRALALKTISLIEGQSCGTQN